MAALREETRLVATARPGTRNDTLNRAAFSLGQLVASAYCPGGCRHLSFQRGRTGRAGLG